MKGSGEEKTVEEGDYRDGERERQTGRMEVMGASG